VKISHVSRHVQSISVQFYVQNFLPVNSGYYQFLPGFPLTWQKYYLLWQKPNPVNWAVALTPSPSLSWM